MKLSRYVKNYRMEHNLSQYDMGLLCELNQTSISLIETGKSKPCFRTVRKLAKGMKLNIEEVRKML